MRSVPKRGRPQPGIASPGLGDPATSIGDEYLSSQTETAPVSLSRRSSVSASDASSCYGRGSTTASDARPSRASSIISTRTKTSIRTLDAPQSIDVTLGRESFRIAREGSVIHISRDDTPAPPYDAPFIRATSTTLEQSEASGICYQTPTSANEEVQPPAPAYDSICTSQNHERNDPESLLSFDRHERDDTSSQLISYDEEETNNDRSTSLEGSGVNRSPSYQLGKDSLSVNWRRTSSGSVTTEESSGTAGAKLQRRNGVRLKLVTKTSGEGSGLERSPLTPNSAVSSGSARSRYTQSPARTPVRSGHMSVTSSPLYGGNGPPGMFPTTMGLNTSDDRNKQLPQIKTSGDGSAYLDEGFIESFPPPSMDTEDEIRIHYNRLLRTIDRNYRVELHARDEDMSKLRERINEMDQVYRSELRARGQEMEDRLQARDKELNELRERIRLLEQTGHLALDTARNEAEVMWELAWKDRDRHIADRLRRLA